MRPTRTAADLVEFMAEVARLYPEGDVHMDDAQRDGLVSNVVGHLEKGVSEPVLERAFAFWRNIDEEIGGRIAKGITGG